MGLELDILFSRNHWSTQEFTIRGVRWAWDWCVRRYMEKHNVGRAEAESKIVVVNCLDCWPTNLTKQTKDAHTSISSRYHQMIIPARGTGRVQVNDTHCHGTFKPQYTLAVSRWYRNAVGELRAKLLRAELSKVEYQKAINGLVSAPRLKAKSMNWFLDSMEVLTRVREYPDAPIKQSCTVVERGFIDLWWAKLHDEDWKAESRVRYQARLEQAKALREEALLQAAVQAAQAIPALADGDDQQDHVRAAVEAARAAVPRLGDFVEAAVNQAIEAVAAAEEHMHLAEVPKVKKRAPPKSGKSRPGRHSRSTFAAKEAAAGLQAEQDVNELLAPKPAAGKKRKAASKPRVPKAKVTAAGRGGGRSAAGSGGRGRGRGRGGGPAPVLAAAAAVGEIHVQDEGEEELDQEQEEKQQEEDEDGEDEDGDDDDVVMEGGAEQESSSDGGSSDSDGVDADDDDSGSDSVALDLDAAVPHVPVAAFGPRPALQPGVKVQFVASRLSFYMGKLSANAFDKLRQLAAPQVTGKVTGTTGNSRGWLVTWYTGDDILLLGEEFKQEKNSWLSNDLSVLRH